MIEDDQGAFEAGMAGANNPADPVTELRKARFVKGWLEEIDRVRRYDEEAYKQLAKDRAYAAGESPFLSKTNIIGGYIDAWHALLYARDPDIDVLPRKLLEKEVILSPEQQQMKQQAAMIGLQMPEPPDPALKLQQDAIDFSKTLSMGIAECWRRGRLKDQADPWTRAALTSKVGWLKATWQSGKDDPVISRPLQDLRDNLARLEAEVKLMDEELCGDKQEEMAQLQLTIAAVEKSTESPLTRGACYDAVDMADITVSDAVPSVGRYLESPWISHRIYKPWKDAVGMFPDVPMEKMKAAATFSPKKPQTEEKGAGLREFAAADADAFGEYTEGGKHVCIEEVWSRRDGQILTFIRGVEQMAREPYSPPPSERFYGFFQLSFSQVDGMRWGQSLNERSQALQDEYDRTNDGLREHRARVKPFTIFNRSAMDAKDADKLAKGSRVEWVGLKPINPKQDIRQLAFPMAYPPVDIALYSVDPLMVRFEFVWGLQEAMTGSVDVAKTATEAEIQQSGTMSRTGSKRDILEDELTEIARYTAQIMLNPTDGFTHEEMVEIVGPNAFWPQLTHEQIQQMVSVDIRAGSSGKPNTRAMRESWQAVMPLLAESIEKIGFLRQSSPDDMAECYEELMRETVDRMGERIDVTRFIPLAGPPPMMGAMPGTPGPGGMPVAAPEVPPGGKPPAEGAPPDDSGFPVRT